jgi:hypothetical protein
LKPREHLPLNSREGIAAQIEARAGFNARRNFVPVRAVAILHDAAAGIIGEEFKLGLRSLLLNFRLLIGLHSGIPANEGLPELSGSGFTHYRVRLWRNRSGAGSGQAATPPEHRVDPPHPDVDTVSFGLRMGKTRLARFEKCAVMRSCS